MRALLMAGIIAGAIAGAIVTAAQFVRVIPLIEAAEAYETGSRVDAQGRHGRAGHPGRDGGPRRGIARHLGTLGANLIAGIGFGLLLVAGLAAAGRSGWRSGLFWGLGGFAAFALAPALGLPPKLPGATTADLAARQIWWVGAAAATAGALWLIFLSRRLPIVLVGVLLLLSPHLLGAPRPAEHGGSAPASMAHEFVVATLATNAVFWVVLGLAAGQLRRRFSPTAKGLG